MERKQEHINLEDLDRENPFSVPDGYFDSFSSRLMSRIDELDRPPVKRDLGMRYLRPMIGLAASFALIALLMYVPVKIIGPQLGKNNNQEELESSEFEVDVLTSDYTFYELLTESLEQEPMAESIIETALLASLSDFELLGY